MKTKKAHIFLISLLFLTTFTSIIISGRGFWRRTATISGDDFFTDHETLVNPGYLILDVHLLNETYTGDGISVYLLTPQGGDQFSTTQEIASVDTENILLSAIELVGVSSAVRVDGTGTYTILIFNEHTEPLDVQYTLEPIDITRHYSTLTQGDLTLNLILGIIIGIFIGGVISYLIAKKKFRK